MPTSPVFSQLEQFLAVTNKRETVIAANMANVDTPGYRTQDIDFRSTLQNTIAGAEGGTAGVTTHNVKGLLERPDGNNVDMDRESMMLAQSQLSYQMGAQLLKARFHQLLTAINGEGAGA